MVGGAWGFVFMAGRIGRWPGRHIGFAGMGGFIGMGGGIGLVWLAVTGHEYILMLYRKPGVSEPYHLKSREQVGLPTRGTRGQCNGISYWLNTSRL